MRPFSFLLLGFGLGLWCTAPAQTAPKNETPSYRYLFLVDTSFSMRRQRPVLASAVREMVRSGFQWKIQPGETFGIWTFNGEVETSRFAPQTWQAGANEELSELAAHFLEGRRFDRRADWTAAMNKIAEAVEQSEWLTVFVLSDGQQPISGTPIDEQLNAIYRQEGRELQRLRRPFLTTFIIGQGALISWSVGAAGEPVDILNLDLTAPLPDEESEPELIEPAPLVAAPPSPPSPPETIAPPELDETPLPARETLSADEPAREETDTPPPLEPVPDQAEPGPVAADPIAIPPPQTPPVTEEPPDPVPSTVEFSEPPPIASTSPEPLLAVAPEPSPEPPPPALPAEPSGRVEPTKPGPDFAPSGPPNRIAQFVPVKPQAPTPWPRPVEAPPETAPALPPDEPAAEAGVAEPPPSARPGGEPVPGEMVAAVEPARRLHYQVLAVLSLLLGVAVLYSLARGRGATQDSSFISRSMKDRK